jgi:hypothetical protein
MYATSLAEPKARSKRRAKRNDRLVSGEKLLRLDLIQRLTVKAMAFDTTDNERSAAQRHISDLAKVALAA